MSGYSSENRSKMTGLDFLKSLRPALFLFIAALVLAIVGFVNYFHTMSAFDYPVDRWVIVFTAFAFALIAFQIVNAVLMGDQFGSVFPLCAAVVLLVLAAVAYLSPCLSNIGIYFTVGNMGNVEADAVGVPSVILGVSLCVASVVCLIVAAFFPAVKADHGLLSPLFGGDNA